MAAVATPYRDASIVTSRPVVPSPIAEYGPPDSLTSGSQLDRAAEGGQANNRITRGKYGLPLLTSGSQLALSQDGAPWPTQIDSGIKRWTAYVPNALRNVVAINVRGNYGGKTSTANFAWRHQEYPVTDTVHGSQAGYPGPVPSERRPMWNNLLAIVWALRVANPVAGGSRDSTIQAAYNPQSYTNPAEFVPAGTASLTFKGVGVA